MLSCLYEEKEICINRRVCVGLEKNGKNQATINFVCPFLPHSEYEKYLGISYEEYKKDKSSGEEGG